MMKLVTAAELRERGFKIPYTIPDKAVITEGAWKLVGEVKVSRDEGVVTFDLGSLVFTEPFRWVDGELLEEEQ